MDIKGFAKNFFDIKFWKFILVGVLNTLVGNGLQFLLYNFTALGNLENNMGYWICSGTSYILASIMSYFLNKYFTFKNNEKGWKPVLRFSLNIAVCYFLAYGLAQPLAKLILSGQPQNIQDNIAMLFAMCLFVAFNYIGQRFFAFKEKKQPVEDNTKDSTKDNK